MEILISNKIRLKQAPKALTHLLINELKIPNPKHHEALQAGRSTWNINPFLYNFEMLPDDSLLVPRGYRSRVLEVAEGMDLQFAITDERTHFEPNFNINSSRIRYRPYQYDAVMKMITAPEGILVAPAGSGKTVIGISLAPLFGQPLLWLTHTTPLAMQAMDRIEFFFPEINRDDIGFIGGGKWKVGERFTVAMVQTLVRRLTELYKIRDSFGLVILDEAHHCPASTFLKVIGYFNPHYLYGLTATPYRRDKLEKLMFQMIGPEIVNIPIREVEKRGGIMRPVVKYKSFSHHKAVHGSNVASILTQNIINNDKRNHLIVGDVIIEAAAGNHCIVTSDRKAHCEVLYDLISTGWDQTGIATGDYSKKYVAEQIEKLNNGDITVLVCTNQLLGEGFDFPPLNRAFVASPFRAEAKCVQLVGRIQRPAPGKTDAIVYDYVDVNVGVLQSQFFSRNQPCRYKAYERLGINIEPF
jgi:superfamily II DNA or RNA helicase